MRKVTIAIPTDDGTTVAPHFGKAKYFVIAEIEDGKEKTRKLVENLHSHRRGYQIEGRAGKFHTDDNALGRYVGLGNGHHHGHVYGRGHEVGHGHGHDEVFTTIGNVDGVIAVRVGPHMFKELKNKKIGVYLVRLGTSVANAIAQFMTGALKDVTVRKI
uniref:Dinitrogenase iron-molybdenum cofactor biosynthesis protein n=1 Tax=Fervidobacterium thailandense TaxID=1008305 RepID=A0A7C4W3U2_9BACT